MTEFYIRYIYILVLYMVRGYYGLSLASRYTTAQEKNRGEMMLPSYYPTKSVFSLTIFSFITILKEYLTLQEIYPAFEHLKNTNKITKLIHYREAGEIIIFFFILKKSKQNH